jgi:hypothetical protein
MMLGRMMLGRMILGRLILGRLILGRLILGRAFDAGPRPSAATRSKCGPARPISNG